MTDCPGLYIVPPADPAAIRNVVPRIRPEEIAAEYAAIEACDSGPPGGNVDKRYM